MNRKLIIVGTIAILAFGATYIFLGSAPNSAPSPSAAAPPKIDVEQVLVAAQDLPMGTVVNDTATSWQAWPKAAVSEFMITKSAKPDALQDVIGAMTRVAFIRGEPIRHDKLVKAGAGGFMSAILPTGKRAVAIKIDNGGDSSAGGFILPNDRVDVVRLARDEDATKARGVEVMTAQTILANVRVLAIGQNVEEQNGKKVITGTNATLELDPDQVNLIILAQQAGNSLLHLALRSLVDSGGPARTVVDADGSGKAGLTVVRYGAAQQAAR
ncbi:MAG: Flp pilus assembly protein CpaB [Roseiarcus sp.]|jgi:pilus assembly protein CpaB|uniref:Flp pilus assembly protein CpaB n=1 Tax=Roseiarcus sp. TaxID=1969460 RepID=UPI003C6AD64B